MAKARNPAHQNSALKSSSFGIAIMAAGKGTRLKSRHPKVLHQVGGMPLLEHVIRAALKVLPPSDIHAIVGHEAQRVERALHTTGINFVLQAEQLGTGHAIMSAQRALEKYEHVLVLSGDVPLIRPQTIERVRDFHLANRAAMTILTAEPEDPGAYGRVLRRRSGSDEVAEIVEYKALNAKQKLAREINSGIYAFDTRDLFAHIHRLSTDNVHREFYLTDMAGILVKAGKKVVALKADNASEVLGANTREELAQLDAALRAHKCGELMAQGVTIFRPETCLIDADVVVGEDTVIEPFVQLLGRTQIGTECRIRSYSIITDSEIADAVTVRPGCIIDGSRIAREASVGPYAHLRPGTQIGEGAQVGNFVETKKTRLGRGSKANHLTYLGDAEIGEQVNVGAGTITCNYDGMQKHTTVIEDGAFIGSDATLVAPVRIGRGAYVAASSCITEDIPQDALAIGRSRQVTKEGWARERRTSRKKTASP